MRLWTGLILVVLLYACNTTPEYEVIDGTLEVPENRLNPDSRTLKLAYKVLKAKKADSLKVPVLFLQGGPGAATLTMEMEAFWKNSPLRNNRDIVLMDQRGTGASEANCTEAGSSLFDIMRQDLDLEGDYKAIANLIAECKQTMEGKGVDLAGYNSRENAADFEDLRKVLGYDQWNLYGVSYGSRLGLTIMRDFPKSVRSAVLAGVLTPESDVFGDRIKTFENSLFEVLRRCEENEECNGRYPNLKERLLKTLEKMETAPLHFDYKEKLFVLNVQDTMSLLIYLLYDRPTISDIPLLIEALENGESEPIADVIQAFEPFYYLMNFSVMYSVAAYEELPFYNAADMDKAIKQSEIGFAFASNSAASLLAEWHPYRATNLENEAIVSEIPTLMVSGNLDPATPPANATGALRHLKNGYEVVFPDESHQFYSACFFQIVENFLNDPLHKPNLECASIRNPIEWNLHEPVQGAAVIR